MLSIQQTIDRLPDTAIPRAVHELITVLDTLSLPTWPSPSLVLHHGDPNARNFLYSTGKWTLVDWEYSGWGDPAFEIANLLMHPGNIGISQTRAEWVIRHYTANSHDAESATRIRTYCLLLVVAWAAYFAHRQYELAHHLGRSRLVQDDARWRQEAARNYAHYVRIAPAYLDVEEQWQ